MLSPFFEIFSNCTVSGCCDVISDRDVNAIRILTEMCGRIITKHEELDPKIMSDFAQGRMNKDVVNTCKREVLNTCGIDITTFLAEQVGLGRTYSQILDNIKSFNNSVCLKQNFGLERGLLGAARHWSHTPLSKPCVKCSSNSKKLELCELTSINQLLSHLCVCVLLYFLSKIFCEFAHGFSMLTLSQIYPLSLNCLLNLINC